MLHLIKGLIGRFQRLSRIAAPHELQLVLYTRKGCHLCEEAHEKLVRAVARYRFEMSVIDVDSNPELTAKHGNAVPVVTVNGKLRFRGRVNEVLLSRLLEAEIAQAKSDDGIPDA